jgi:hypothetical protein
MLASAPSPALHALGMARRSHCQTYAISPLGHIAKPSGAQYSWGLTATLANVFALKNKRMPESTPLFKFCDMHPLMLPQISV